VLYKSDESVTVKLLETLFNKKQEKDVRFGGKPILLLPPMLWPIGGH